MSDSKWSEGSVPSQAGRTAVVTGANTGIGYEAARVLAAKGARVVLAVRNLDKGKDAAARISAATPGADVTVQKLDLSSLASVREAAEELRGIAVVEEELAELTEEIAATGRKLGTARAEKAELDRAAAEIEAVQRQRQEAQRRKDAAQGGLDRAREHSARRAELEAARDAKYREIRDAELDHRTGKLSEADWRGLDRTLRREAVEILRELDRLP